MTTGNYNLEDLRANRFASAAEFGLDKINDVLQADLAYYNQVMQDQMSLLAEPVTVQSQVFGTSAMVQMDEVDEYGASPSKKTNTGVTVSFPLRLFSSTVGWTSKYLQIATPAEIAEKYLQVQRGHADKVIKEVRKSIFNNTNYNFVDNLTNGVTLGVKRFYNADSTTIPDSPAGATFDGATHTHYTARAAALAATDVDALVSNVTEHGNTRGVKIIVALADKATIQGLTGFVALGDGGIVYNATDSTVVKMNFDDLENQLIGYWKNTSVEIWVKPWGLANYWLCVATEAVEKPLAFRQRPQTALQGLRLAANINDYPLIAESFEAEFGLGVYNRSAGAVLYIGNTTWANPSL